MQYKSVTQDASYGTETVVWNDLKTVSCEFVDMLPSKSEAVINGAIDVATIRTRVRMRYRNDIDTTMRLKTKISSITHYYQLISGPSIINQGRHMEFIAERYSS